MAKAKKSVKKVEEESVQQPAKKMTKEYAQQVVKNYSGINGVDVPELKEAKEFLKRKSE